VTTPRIVPAGDAALIVEFDERIDATVSARAVATAATMERLAIAGVRDIVPTYRSVAVYFDPLRTDVERLGQVLRHAALTPAPAGELSADIVDVPVCYDADLGPDLADVARRCGLEASDVVALHTARAQRVFMLGFVPGFAYMGTVDARIAVPRRESPRLRVPAGSVAIAGQQTGIYPMETPGGWNIIGRTPVRVWNADAARPCLFRVGSVVRFHSVDRDEFDRLLAQRVA
jgi:inhibitor of KinA